MSHFPRLHLHYFWFLVSGSQFGACLGSLGEWWVLRAGKGQVCIFASETTSQVSLELWNNKHLFGVWPVSSLIQGPWEPPAFLLFSPRASLGSPGKGSAQDPAVFSSTTWADFSHLWLWLLSSQDKGNWFLEREWLIVKFFTQIPRVVLVILGSYSCSPHQITSS